MKEDSMFNNLTKFFILQGWLLIFSTVYCCTNICDFDGWVAADPLAWEEVEFNVFLADKKMPEYYFMVKTVRRIFVTDAEILRSQSCKIHKYVEKLVVFYNKNKKIIEDNDETLADMLAFIKNKIEVENKK